MPFTRRTPFRFLPAPLCLALAASLAVAPAAAGTPAPSPAPGATDSLSEETVALLESAIAGPTADEPPASVPQKALEVADPAAATRAAHDIRGALAAAGEPAASERIDLADRALDALGIEALSARMGQGVERMEESGNPKAPTVDELAALADAAADVAGAAPAASPAAPASPSSGPASPTTPAPATPSAASTPPSAPPSTATPSQATSSAPSSAAAASSSTASSSTASSSSSAVSSSAASSSAASPSAGQSSPSSPATPGTPGSGAASPSAATHSAPAGASPSAEAAPALELERTGVVAPASWEELRTWRPPGVHGVDVASHQGEVDWSYAWSQGARFAYVKATQSWPNSLYKNPYFGQQYNGSYDVGMLRGAYHFAMPAASSPSEQARQFVQNGGAWSADGRTLPPLLDIEWNPYDAETFPEGQGDACYGMTPAEMEDWIYSFGVNVKSMTGRLPMIYTAQSWWDDCTGDSTRFRNWPLHVALYPTSDAMPKNPRELPEGWNTFRIWQYTSNADYIHPTAGVDGNVFNGDMRSLRDFARNERSTAHRMTTDYLGRWVTTSSGDWNIRLTGVRAGGSDRYAAPIAASRRQFPGTAPTVTLVSGSNSYDSLTGSPVAATKGGPLLVTRPDYVPADVLAEVRRLNPARIYIVGDTGTLSGRVESELETVAPVTRLDGAGRYGANAAASQVWRTSSIVYVGHGASWANSASVAAVAARVNRPLLLTPDTRMHSVTVSQLKRLDPEYVIIGGNASQVSANVVDQIRAAVPDASVSRRGGTDAYGTAALFSYSNWPDGSQRTVFASGTNAAGGLAAPVVAAYDGAPLLLSHATCIPSNTATALYRTEGWTYTLVGPSSVLSSYAVYGRDGNRNIC